MSIDPSDHHKFNPGHSANWEETTQPDMEALGGPLPAAQGCPLDIGKAFHSGYGVGANEEREQILEALGRAYAENAGGEWQAALGWASAMISRGAHHHLVKK